MGGENKPSADKDVGEALRVEDTRQKGDAGPSLCWYIPEEEEDIDLICLDPWNRKMAITRVFGTQ